MAGKLSDRFVPGGDNQVTDLKIALDALEAASVVGVQGPQGATGPAGQQGIQGPAGIGLVNKGAWVASTTYAVGDYVIAPSSASITTNALWVSQAAFTSSTTPRSDLAHWVELPGLPGPAGPAGSQGIQGIQGLTGPAGTGFGNANGIPVIPSFTLATLPDPTSINVRAMIYVTDYPGGAVLAFSDGTNWRKISDRSVITKTSATGLLANKIIGEWHWAYSPPSLATLMASAPQVNHVEYVIAVGDGALGGTIRMDTAVNTADVTAWKASGRTITFLIGGSADNGIHVTTTAQATQFVNSVSSIIDTFGFQGFGLDLKQDTGQWLPSVMASACSQLRTKYGSTLLITISPEPYQIRDNTGIYEQFVTSFGIGNIDLIDVQWFSAPGQTDAWFLNTYIGPDISTMTTALAIPASKILIGAASVASGSGAPGWPTTYKTAYQNAIAAGQAIRGVMNWQDADDANNGYAFANTMGPVVV